MASDGAIRTAEDLAKLELGFESVLSNRVRSMTIEALAGVRTPAAVIALVEAVLAYGEAAIAEVTTHNPPPKPLACRSGCHACCHNLIVTTPPQVLALAADLRARLTPVRLAKLGDRLRQPPAIGELRPACPLLKSRKCQAYDWRPVNCRGWTSLDRQACDADLKRPGSKGISFYVPQSRITAAIEKGLILGTAAAGLPAEPVALAPALATALELPDACERWLAGEPVFATARV